MKKLLLVFASLLFAAQSFANDSAVSGTSGTPGNLKATVLAGEHKTIRMVREQIEMKVGRDDYVTDANFIFHNDGAATTVRMGFPEGAGGDSDFEEIKKKTSFKEFETWIDGRKIKATRMLSGYEPEMFEFDAYWVKSVRFARNQTRRVRVRYRSELGSVSDQSQYMFYNFTGGNWKGKVDETTLRLIFTVPGTYGLYPNNELKSKPIRREKNGEISLRWKNWQAQEGFTFRFVRTLPNAMNWAYEQKYLNERDELVAGMKPFVVKGSSKFDPWKVQAADKPIVLLRDGRAFIQFRKFSEDMRESWVQKNKNRKLQYGAGMHAKNGQFVAPFYGKENQSITVAPGSKTARIGAREIQLPAAPFLASGVLYVPIVAMIEGAGGKVKVNAKTMRYWYEFSA